VAEEPKGTGGAVRYLPGGFAVGLAITAMIGAWLLVLGGLAGTVALLSRLGSAAVLPLALMCGSVLPAALATRRVLAFHRIRAKVPAPLLRQLRYGDLSEVTGDDGRPLRPVGMSVADVVVLTDAQLGPVTELPGTRIFQGVRLPGVSRPVASHAVSAGRLLVLIESVAWPPGEYRVDATGRVRCDDQYIGQTVRSLCNAVHAYRRVLPGRHQVCAFVVVHRLADGQYLLPPRTADLRWALADDFPAQLHAMLTPHLSAVSRHTIAALTH
jgi:hypothetical protein